MKKIWPVILAGIVLASCYMPPYREDLSLALPVAKQLEGVEVVGPLSLYQGEFEDWDIVFYPSIDSLKIRTNDVVRGFIVATTERRARLMFVDHIGEYEANYWNEIPIGDVDEKQFVYRAMPAFDGVDDTNTEYLGIIAFDNDSGMRQYWVFDDTLGYTGPVLMDTPGLLLGAGFFHYAVPGPIPVEYLVLNTLRIESGDQYLEEYYDINDIGGLGTPNTVRTGISLPGLPKDINNCFYYRLPAPLSSTQRSYLSVYDSVRREYRNFSWDDSLGLQVLTGMDRRIDQLLSNGWLFSEEDNKGYVYNGDGELINSFVMGGLKLVFEIFDGAIYRSVFTIPVWAPDRTDSNDWESRLYFLVYWVPTEKLDDL
jgi:hypothetical protein